MTTPALFQPLVRLARAHPKATRRLLAGTGLWVAACFALGYRVPWFDQHPDWPYFPHTTNPRLVVEPIPDSVFERRYRARFPSPPDGPSPEGRSPAVMQAYHARLPNIRSLGLQITDNEFDSDIHYRFYPGANDIFPDRDTVWEPGFHNYGYEYLELRLGDQVGYFKERCSEDLSGLFGLYQYNTSKNINDTIFVTHEFDDKFKIYFR